MISRSILLSTGPIMYCGFISFSRLQRSPSLSLSQGMELYLHPRLLYFYNERLGFFFFFWLIFLGFVFFGLGEENEVIEYFLPYPIHLLISHCFPAYLESVPCFFLKFHQLFLLFWTGFSKFASRLLTQSFGFFFFFGSF